MEENKKMIFDDKAREEFYSAELESGEFFLEGGRICHSNMLSKGGIKKLRNATFPENAVTVLG